MYPTKHMRVNLHTCTNINILETQVTSRFTVDCWATSLITAVELACYVVISFLVILKNDRVIEPLTLSVEDYNKQDTNRRWKVEFHSTFDFTFEIAPPVQNWKYLGTQYLTGGKVGSKLYGSKVDEYIRQIH